MGLGWDNFIPANFPTAVICFQLNGEASKFKFLNFAIITTRLSIWVLCESEESRTIEKTL